MVAVRLPPPSATKHVTTITDDQLISQLYPYYTKPTQKCKAALQGIPLSRKHITKIKLRILNP